MGILNVTPDSFSDGGRHLSLQAAVNQAEKMIDEDVDIIDIGGESTRPFAEPVTLAEELNRVIPVIETLRSKYQVKISIDTTKAEVARQALAAGADIINDVSALQHDPGMIELVKSSSVPVIIMHMQGTPGNMQVDPQYDDVVTDIIDFFRKRLEWLEDKGVNLSRITIDPGVGFGKTLAHNLTIIKHLDKFNVLGQPVLLGHSRKRFLGEITGHAEADERDLATAVISALATYQNVDMVRVHNVGATREALRVAQAIADAK